MVLCFVSSSWHVLDEWTDPGQQAQLEVVLLLPLSGRVLPLVRSGVRGIRGI